MLQIELVPDLSSCIETVARKEYQKTINQLLITGAEDKELQHKAEALRLFLMTADFKKLRCESEEQLLQGRQVKFLVFLEADVPKYEMQIT